MWYFAEASIVAAEFDWRIFFGGFTAIGIWATAWMQLVLLPFFSRREELHNQFFSSEFPNAVAAIESNRLIPPLARILAQAYQAHRGRSKIDFDTALQLLQDVDFLEDFEQAQAAMSSINNLERFRIKLRLACSVLWYSAASHVLASLLLMLPFFAMISAMDRLKWSLSVLAIVIFSLLWLGTLILTVGWLIRYRQLIGTLTALLETDHTR
ncbi:hypothetical protein [Stratiformator vulcanicus]|uniref:Uncharacterized protein n=1 Tax=Stratiformator vulcanicus TaxID=2527980 RepID=A0A517QY34_9PLAN|nr:hypothetical protein [Stratiformator vulcanicus]QDT36470.1 hypothetical protein Pan189_08270 [Stratiformator vulcanicus]